MFRIERHYRVVANVWVSLGRGAVAPGSLPWFDLVPRRDGLAEEVDGAAAARSRLIHTLVQTRSAVDAWFCREAVRHVLDWGLEGFRIPVSEGELLHAVIAGLQPPDRRFFETAPSVESLCELVDPVFEAVSAHVRGVSANLCPSETALVDTARLGRLVPVVLETVATVSRIEPGTAESTWGRLRREGGYGGALSLERFVTLQHSVLEALLHTDPTVLDLWLKQEVIHEILDYGDAFEPTELTDREIFAPALLQLDGGDRQRFASGAAGGSTEELIHDVLGSCRASTREVLIAESREADEPSASMTGGNPAAYRSTSRM